MCVWLSMNKSLAKQRIRKEDILDLLGGQWERLQGTIATALHSDIPMLEGVNRRILEHGGKMLRPCVTMLMARACAHGSLTDDSYNYAAAVELLHNATLLHDDVADESDIRRGLPTLRAILGPGPAVLVGDFWLSRAVDLILAAKQHDEVITLFSKTLSDLAEGEMLQLEKSVDLSTSLEDYYKIIHCKTGSLFVTASVAGAISVGAGQTLKDAARGYGEALGTAFQIRDDILDYVGDGGLGKPTGIDLKEKKITLPLFMAMQGTPYEKKIRKKLHEGDGSEEISEEIRKFVIDHGGVDKAEEILSAYVEKALDALDPLPQSKEKACLEAVARLNLKRRK